VVAVAALIAFAASVGASLYVLLPSKNLVFAFAGSRALEELEGLPLEEAHRLLAYDLDRFWTANDAILAKLLSAFRFS
jgi:hypothetical protein